MSLLKSRPVAAPPQPAITLLERRLAAALRRWCAPLDDPLSRIVLAPGKRLRPTLTMAFAHRLVTGELSVGRQGRALDLAVAVELLHSATLVHDDLIDEAATRRTAATVHAREGLATAVVGGDLLIAAAGAIASEVDPRAGALVTRTLLDLCRGEAAQHALRFHADATPDQLLEIARLKSGSLLRCACELGALAAGVSEDVGVRVGAFGEQFGLTLQLVDDVLDLVSSPQLAGKPVGVDFAAGVVTVPASAALAQHPELAGLLVADADELTRARSLALLRSPSAVRAGTVAAGAAAQAAFEVLDPLCERFPRTHELAVRPAHYLQAELSQRVDPAFAHLLTGRPAS